MSLNEVMKHLQGQHDQSSHASKKRSFGDPVVGKAGADIRKAWAKLETEEEKEKVRDLVEKYYDGTRTLRQSWVLALGIK